MDALTFQRSVNNKREREEEGLADSSDAKRLHTDILYHILDDADDDDVVVQVPGAVEGDIDSVVRSLEAEIGLSPSCLDRSVFPEQPELGFLLEASDYELGLPPTFDDEPPAISGGLWGFDEISNCYDAFDLGFGHGGCGDGELEAEDGVVLLDGGLFGDFGDVAFQMPSDLWLPAV